MEAKCMDFFKKKRGSWCLWVRSALDFFRNMISSVCSRMYGFSYGELYCSRVFGSDGQRTFAVMELKVGFTLVSKVYGSPLEK